MTKSFLEQAGELAIEAIQKGKDPKGMVHILYYPDNSVYADEQIQGISTPISPEDYAKGGLIGGRYYSLEELASLVKTPA